ATIGVQYYLNLRTQQESLNLRRLQSQALVAGTAIGFTSVTSPREEDRVEDLLNRPGQSFIDPETRAQIIDIIVIDNQWRVRDAVNDDYEPTYASQDETPKESSSNVRVNSN